MSKKDNDKIIKPLTNDYTTSDSVLIKKHKSEKIFIEPIESYVKNLQISIEFSDRKTAQFDIYNDQIQLPAKYLFHKMLGLSREQNYYSTLFHEIIHWTGHEKRLRRKSIIEYDDTKKDRRLVNLCALEELTAELGCNMLMQHFGLQTVLSVYSLKYINTEINLINTGDQIKIYNKAIKQASKAFDYLMKFEQRMIIIL